ncbi:MAG: hypothetical protein ACRCYZ_06785 [Alphaproteobacteria bacterium]
MLTTILSFLGGPVIGSLIGAVGGYFNRRLDVQLKRAEIEAETARRAADRAHEVAMREWDIKVAQAEAEGKARLAVIEGTAAMEVARFDAIGKINQADAGHDDWIDGLRRSVRPVMTYVLTLGALAVNGVLLWRMREVWPDLPAAERSQLVYAGISWVGTQASAALAFWFVSRPAEFPK